MKKRFTEEQIIGFLREADARMAVKDLCRRHGFSEALKRPTTPGNASTHPEIVESHQAAKQDSPKFIATPVPFPTHQTKALPASAPEAPPAIVPARRPART